MTAWQWLGAGMFVSLLSFVVVATTEDWREAMQLTGFIIAVLTFVFVSVLLISGLIP